jgi:hypothetical protein
MGDIAFITVPRHAFQHSYRILPLPTLIDLNASLNVYDVHSFRIIMHGSYSNALGNCCYCDLMLVVASICIGQRFSNCGARPSEALLIVWRVQVVCMKDMFILDEIWAHDKTYIVVDILLD